MGLPIASHLSTFMVNFIETIRQEKIPLDQETILSENLCEQLRMVKDKKFYITSYMVYLLAARVTNYPILYSRASMQDPNVWPYIVYPQLVKKKLSTQSKEYKIVNDAFIFVIIQFIKRDYVKRLFDKAKAYIIVLGAYFIQFKPFTYLQVLVASIDPKKLPRYLSDKLVLLEIYR